MPRMASNGGQDDRSPGSSQAVDDQAAEQDESIDHLLDEGVDPEDVHPIGQGAEDLATAMSVAIRFEPLPPVRLAPLSTTAAMTGSR